LFQKPLSAKQCFLTIVDEVHHSTDSADTSVSAYCARYRENHELKLEQSTIRTLLDCGT
jgi:hypothetical protein